MIPTPPRFIEKCPIQVKPRPAGVQLVRSVASPPPQLKKAKTMANLSWKRLALSAVVGLLLLDPQPIDGHPKYVTCDLAMTLCGHAGKVFPGGGGVMLRDGPNPIPCGSQLSAERNFTILDVNISGLLIFLLCIRNRCK